MSGGLAHGIIAALENPQSSVILWVLSSTSTGGDNFPILFRAALWRYAHKRGQPVAICSAGDSVDALRAHLSISFLGARYWYWLGVCTKIHEKLLADYSGPHILLGAITRAEQDIYRAFKSNPVLIDIPARIKLAEAYQLCVKIGAAPAVPDTLLQELSREVSSTVTLDQAILLGHYITVTGSPGIRTCYSLLSSIIAPEESLFDLSSAFFGDNHSVRAGIWLRVRDRYPGQYWITFFAEQLWQSILFLEERLQKTSGTSGMTQKYRLPFSFTTRDYKNYTFDTLQKAYQDIFFIDNSAKQGADLDAQLDLFIARFNN